MITESELLALLGDVESSRVERTVSTKDTDKFSQAVCAFANDLPGSRLPGFLLIGADDKFGKPSGLKVDDELLRNLAGLRRVLQPHFLRVGMVLSEGTMICHDAFWRVQFFPGKFSLENGRLKDRPQNIYEDKP